MNLFKLRRLVIFATSFLMVSFVHAMPPAPSGPYQSIEDEFIQTPMSRQELPLEQRAIDTTPQRSYRNELREWSWNAPPMPHPNGPYRAMNPDNYYPQDRHGNNYYRYPAQGEAR